jgi:hypothetical protein
MASLTERYDERIAGVSGKVGISEESAKLRGRVSAR